ncbi:MAG TPA: Rrf2 family transcriptional regulator, partial [Trueperaceae bacterium]
MPELRTLLKRDESYAVHTLISVAENPGTSTADIAERLQLPPAFTAKVVRKLVKAGFIDSQMGRSGGLSLKADLERVSLLDVIEGISGKLVLDTCQTKRLCATQQRKGRCNLKLAWLASTLQIRD